VGDAVPRARALPDTDLDIIAVVAAPGLPVVVLLEADTAPARHGGWLLAAAATKVWVLVWW